MQQTGAGEVNAPETPIQNRKGSPGSGVKGEAGFGPVLPDDPGRPLKANSAGMEVDCRRQALICGEPHPDPMRRVIQHDGFAAVAGIVGHDDLTVHFGPFGTVHVLVVRARGDRRDGLLERTLNPSQIGTVRFFCPKEARFHAHGVV